MRNSFHLPKLFVVFLILITVSCEKEVDFNIPDLKPALVLNSFIHPDSLIKVNISSTQNNDEFAVEYIPNAKITLYENGFQTDSFQYRSTGDYVSVSKKPSPGFLYSIEVSASGFQSISAEDTMPGQMSIIEIISHKYDSITDSEGTKMSWLKLKLTDYSEMMNYFQLRVLLYYQGQQNNNLMDTWFSTQEPFILQEGDIDYYPRFVLFTDQSFSGGAKIFEVYYGGSECIGCAEPLIIVELRTISENYYQYKKKLIRHLENQGSDFWNGMANPLKMFTNVVDGYGIFAGYVVCRDTIQID